MKTTNRFTSEEEKLFIAKSKLSHNFQILAQIGHYLTSKLTDSDFILDINRDLEDFIENTDTEISKYLKDYESDNKKNIN